MVDKNYSVILLLIGVLLAPLASCNNRNRGTWQVTDVSRDTLLNAETDISDVTTMILNIDGHTDDSIKVHGIAIEGGNISKEIRTDWHNSKISVKFEAYRAKKGNIKIRYYLPPIY